MVRALVPAAVALALAGCLEELHELEVTNAGSSDVRVRVEYTVWVEDDWGGRSEEILDETRVAPGETVTLGYPEESLFVTIARVLDGAVLYEEVLTDGEFEDEHGEVEIVVYP